MRRELLMPKLGLTMTEGALAEWLLAPGATFKTGDGLFVVETDKVASEVPADQDGILLEVLVPVGEMVQVGAVVGYVDDAAVGSAATQGAPSAIVPVSAPGVAAALVPVSTQKPVVDGPRRFATPLARRLAIELGVALEGVTGTGPRGRIKAANVRAAVPTLQTQRPASARTDAVPSLTDAVPSAVPAGVRVKPTPTQLTIARRLTQAKQQIPHFYLAAEAEVTKLTALRNDLNAITGHPKVTLTHLLIAAVAHALHDLPPVSYTHLTLPTNREV